MANFKLVLSGSGVAGAAYSASLSSASDNYITKVFGENPRGDKEAYVYLNLPFSQTLVSSGSVFISGSGGDVTDGSGSGVFGATSPLDFTKDYQAASSPYILSQKVGGSAVNLLDSKHIHMVVM